MARIVPINTKVVITACIHGHQFKIGSTVRIIGIENPESESPHYRASQRRAGTWWLGREEFKVPRNQNI